MAQPVKSYEELTFADDFMFCTILQNEQDLCKELVEIILDRKIGEIVKTEEQKRIEITADGHGVRFDVYMEDEQALLDYIEGKAPESDFTRRLDEQVKRYREHKERRAEYMTLLERDEMMREEGRKQGREEGRAEERVRTEAEAKRADAATQRADAAEERIRQLEK